MADLTERAFFKFPYPPDLPRFAPENKLNWKEVDLVLVRRQSALLARTEYFEKARWRTVRRLCS